MGVIEIGLNATKAKNADKFADALAKEGEAYQACFETPAGQKVIADLAIQTGYFEVLDSPTEVQLRDHNSRRSVFHRIISLAQINSERVAAIHRTAEAIKAAKSVV